MATLLMLFPGTVSASGDSEVVLADNGEVRVVQSGDWVIWDFREELPEPDVVTVKGTLTPSGECHYAMSKTSDGSTIAGFFRLYREVAHNQSECLLTFEAANLPIVRLGEFDKSDPGGATMRDKFVPVSQGEASALDGGEPLAATATTSTAWFKSVYEDPVQIDVNNIKVNLQWTWNGSCVTASSNHTAVWYYQTLTGWFIHSKSGNGGRTCASAFTQASGEFRTWTWNDDSLLTWTKHTNTKITGKANGSIAASWSLTKGGENNSLLHTDFLCSWTSC